MTASYDKAMTRSVPTLRLNTSPASIAHAGRVLRAGGLVAMPTETVYGLAAVARNAAAVEQIFAAKARPHWDPLIVHIADRQMVDVLARCVTAVEKRVMEAFWPGPLTLLLPRLPDLPDAVTAGRELVGVRMPAHPIARALIEAAGSPLAAPSANRFGHVSPTTADHVLNDLDGLIDAVVDAGPCGVGVESTVVHCTPNEIVLYRAGGVDSADLERTVGLPVRVFLPPSADAAPQSLPSPGVGIRHYATRAQILLVGSEAELADLVGDPAHGNIAVLLPTGWQRPSHSVSIRTWAHLDDAAALAADLYSALRDLDAQGPAEIVVPLPAREDGLFAALRDRLQKAARRA